LKKITIVGSRHTGTKNSPQILAEHLTARDLAVQVIYWEDLLFAIKTGDIRLYDREQPLFVDKPDLVIALGWYKNGRKAVYRDIAFSLALYLDSLGIKFWNQEMLHQRSTTKLSCMMQLALAGVPVPTTYFSLQADLALDSQPLPYIAKAVAASRGASNYLIRTDAERAALPHTDIQYLVQPFLPNDHDLRVICFGGKPAMVLRRSRAKAANTHLNNTSQGGEGVWLPLETMPLELLTISEKICTIMHREMAGIDFIPDQGSPFGYSCLEVNAIPQLTSGHDIDKKLDAFVRSIA
jgi:glutathione synthase/RimK-type ligase-like ATP-grasp enzyme